MNVKFYFLAIFFMMVFRIDAQIDKDVEKILNSYDLNKLNELYLKFKFKNDNDKKEAYELAKLNNWPIVIRKNNTFSELQRVFYGQPLYYTTYNVDAAVSTRANFLHDNGGLGLNIEGQNMYAFVWDGGNSNVNHQEFSLDAGGTRLIAADNSSLSDVMGLNHATHVMGTIISKGHVADAMGMAPQAIGYTFDWNNDIAEVLSAINFGMLLSNHSYGPNLGFLSDWSIGAYTSESRDWDEIQFNAPYYLQINAAGNDGFSFENGLPLQGNPIYDKLFGATTSKNSLVVANANDAIINGQGDIIGGSIINSSSSQGPTDDFRIKPDITGNGTDVYSPVYASNSYETYSGTSMASPNVYGSLLLLQQLYNQEFGSFMLAATLKGLALHTADDRGSMGPDTKYGWGYMNTKKAAETILDNNQIIKELVLHNGETFSFEVTALGSEPLKASISWTDKQSENVNTGVANDSTPVLINDLDIVLSKGGIDYLPWKLTGVNTNIKADNFVDPFERVDIDNPSSVYTVTISHKGNLDDNLQNYSLIITGISYSTVAVEENIFPNFDIFPNPVNDGIINIAFNNVYDKSKFVLRDILGKIVFEKWLNTGDNVQNINLTTLSSGIYSVTLYTNGNKITKKIIINN